MADSTPLSNGTSSQPSPFREFLPDLQTPRFQTMAVQDCRTYANDFKTSGNPPWLHALYMHWLELYQEPFSGITNDGIVRPNLFEIADEGVDIVSIVTATAHMLTTLTIPQHLAVLFHLDAPEWRTWSNPEFLLSDKGVRLDELPMEARDAVLDVLRASLSPEGYLKAISAMRVNYFLGEIVGSPSVMNEFSYNFALFGKPSTTAPWGFSFYGHHLCLNIFFYRTQMIVSPWFTGAEPNLIDSGPYKGTRILQTEEDLGLQLMQSLPLEKQSQAQVYKLMRDPAMPHGRWNHDDQRHLCGAYRDNRIVPYEGVLVSEFSDEQQHLVFGIIEQYLLYLPESARNKRLEQIRSHLAETYFCWIGGFGDEDPFYYRLQSPVIIVEFDHHSGVFLNNKEPAKFHIHTLLRTPNGGDYGYALRPLIQGREQAFMWEEGKH